jgi:signal transduction histidine kinase
MSLRLRLVLLTSALVALLAVVLSALQLKTLIDSLSRESITHAKNAASQTSAFLIEHIGLRVADYPTPTTPAETARTWTDIVMTEPALTPFLLRTIGDAQSLREINIADAEGRIIASSTPGATTRAIEAKDDFADWSLLPWYRRGYDLLSHLKDWQVVPGPIGVEGSDDPVLRIQVITSAVFVRETLREPFWELASVSAAAILLSLLLTLLVTHSALRPLQRIEQTIDRIAQGQFEKGEVDQPLAKEFQALQSKLDLLGQKVAHVAPQPPRALEQRVEQMATQFDIASRLSAISRLSGGVAHEIKNPLNAILLRLDLLKARLADADDEVGAELNVLSKEVLRLNRVVTTFLDFSRPVEVHYEDVELASVAREVADLMRPQAESVKVGVILSAEPAWVRGDSDLLKQAVLNLVTNAVEAMAATGGTLRVTVAREVRNVVVEVADTGPGIALDLRDKVFQLYFTSKEKGSGIGLALSFRAAQLHHGTLGFTSEMGVGTTFRLELPVAEATEVHA